MAGASWESWVYLVVSGLETWIKFFERGSARRKCHEVSNLQLRAWTAENGRDVGLARKGRDQWIGATALVLKGGIGGTYHAVSAKYLQAYIDEYAFRYNNREAAKGMFEAFLDRIEKAAPKSAS